MLSQFKKLNLKLYLKVLAVLLILDSVLILSLSGGFNLGNLLPGFLGVFIFLYLLFRKLPVYREKRRFFLFLEGSAAGFFAAWLLSFGIFIFIIMMPASNPVIQKPDCILILGTGIMNDRPSLALIERMEKGIAYYKQHPDSRMLIVSGGQGVGESIPEAEAMKRYLVSKGIRDTLINKEEKSTSTFENIDFSLELYKKMTGSSMKSAVIVTSDFHRYRSVLIAHRFEVEAVGIGASTPFFLYPNVLLREYFALLKTFFFDIPI